MTFVGVALVFLGTLNTIVFGADTMIITGETLAITNTFTTDFIFLTANTGPALAVFLAFVTIRYFVGTGFFLCAGVAIGYRGTIVVILTRITDGIRTAGKVFTDCIIGTVAIGVTTFAAGTATAGLADR